jgi:hypothetical protein
VACSPFLYRKILQWAGHVVRIDDPSLPHNGNNSMVQGKEGSLGRPIGRLKVAFARDAVDFLCVWKWNEAATETRLGEGDRGGHRHENGPRRNWRRRKTRRRLKKSRKDAK